MMVASLFIVGAVTAFKEDSIYPLIVYCETVNCIKQSSNFTHRATVSTISQRVVAEWSNANGWNHFSKFPPVMYST